MALCQVSASVCRHSLRLAVLGFFLGPELCDLLLNLLIHSLLELLPVSEAEQQLKPDEQRRKEQRLHEIVKKRWGTTLELPMADELENPSDGKYCACHDSCGFGID